MTTVGSGGPGSASNYGAFDLGGNVYEWNDQDIRGSRVLRGGSWGNNSGSLQSSFRDNIPPSNGFSSTNGFRVAGP